MTRREKERAVKKVDIAIDKIIDLQDMGLGCDTTGRILELLHNLAVSISNKTAD